MGILVDIIIILFVALSAFLAYRKGLVKLAIQLCAFIIAIAITFVLYQPISNFVIYNTNIDETIENAIYKKANQIMQEEKATSENGIMEVAEKGMLPQTARTLSINIVRGGVILLLYLAIQIALRFITALANFVSKLPIINQLNKAGGLIYGLVRGILIIYIVLLILNVVGQINPANQVKQSIDQSYLGKIMYENNILQVFFYK